jgi:hypothetical protein
MSSVSLIPAPSPRAPCTEEAQRALLLEIQHINELADRGASPSDLLPLVVSIHHRYQYSFRSGRLLVGTEVVRARVNPKVPMFIGDLGYPLPHFCKKNGRANEPDESMFYASFGRAPCFYECGAAVGDKFIFSSWRVVEPFWLHHLGYCAELSKSLAGDRTFITAQSHVSTNPCDQILQNWHSVVLTKIVPKGQENLYNLGIALARWALMPAVGPDGAILKFGGVVYPSVASDLVADNIVILPKVVDSCLVLEQASAHIVKEIVDRGLLRTTDRVVNAPFVGKLLTCGLDRMLQWDTRGPFEENTPD